MTQRKKNTGEALITLVVFVAVAVIVASSAVMIAANNIQGASKVSITEETLSIAEAGADNAILRLLRDPTYTGETLPVGNGSAVITVTGTTTKTVTSQSTYLGFRRSIQVVAQYASSSGVISVVSWKEVD
jgi:type II secretory pathway component PulK